MLEHANDATSAWVGFAVAYGLILLTPGPNLVLVLDAACAEKLRTALASALGVASGAALLSALAVVASAFIAPAGALVPVSQIAFGALIMALGVRTLRSAGRARSPVDAASARRLGHFQIAFVTALANPITGVFFIAAASSLGPASGLQQAVVCASVFAAAAAWFGAVAAVGSGALRLLRRVTSAGALFSQSIRLAAGFSLVALGCHRLTVAALPML